jgi:hypothetical protein
MELRSRALEDWDPETSGYTKVGDNTYEWVDAEKRITITRIEGGWLSEVEMLVGIDTFTADLVDDFFEGEDDESEASEL